MEHLYDELKTLVQKYLYVGKTHLLSSGKTSSIYVDIKALSLHPRGAYLLSKIVAKMIPDDTSFIGGIELGSVTIVSLVQSYLIHVEKRDIPAFIVRKKKKKHGLEKELECPYSVHGKIILIEDVITTGTSLLKPIKLLRPCKIISIIDREEYCSEFKQYISLVEPVLRLKELI